MSDAATLFKRSFGFPPSHQTKVPWGLPLLGHHAAAGQGLAMTVALDRGISVAVSPRKDGRIELASSEWDGVRRFARDVASQTEATNTTVATIEATLALLQQRKFHFSGFSGTLAFDADIEPGWRRAGALALSIVLAVRELYPFRLTETGFGEPPVRGSEGRLPGLLPAEKWRVADICREVVPASTARGIERIELLAALFHRSWSVTSLDLKNCNAEYNALPGVAFVLRPVPADKNPDADKFEFRCHAAADRLGVAGLRTVELKALMANRDRLTPEEFAAAHYFVAELARVVAAERALREDDQRQFGEYVWQSHEERAELGLVGPESVRQLAILRRPRLCLGAGSLAVANPAGIVGILPIHLAPGFLQGWAVLDRESAENQKKWAVCKPAEGEN